VGAGVLIQLTETALGTTTVYLLPQEPSIDPKRYRSRVKAALLKMGVIGKAHYDDEPTWYVAGANSTSPFKDTDSDDIGFEYCIITASSNVEVVPQDPAVEPRCPGCGAKLHELFYEVVNEIDLEYEGRKKSEKYLEARITCPKCKKAWALTELRDDVGIFLSGTWVNFEDVQSELRPDWLASFNKETGWRHKAMTYWYT
jgi:hypothetical protein